MKRALRKETPYTYTQLEAQDRVKIKRPLRAMGISFEKADSTINLAILLRSHNPSFEFPSNVQTELDAYDRTK